MKAEFKDRLKYAMNLKGFKAVDMCERANIPKSAMSYYLSGRSEPKTDRLYEIAKILDVSEAWLLGFDVEIDRSQDQKENDMLAELVDRLKKEKDFRQLIIKISKLKPEQILVIKNFLDAFQNE